MWLERVTGSAEELIDLASAKRYLRVLTDETDQEIQDAISAAVAFLDVDQDGYGGLGFPLISQEWDLKIGSFCPAAQRLPFSLVRGVTSVTYIDAQGTSQLLPASEYSLLKSGRSWLVQWSSAVTPVVQEGRADAVVIRFVSGWADLAAVPHDVQNIAKVLMSHFFHSRGSDADTEMDGKIIKAVDRITARYQRFAI